MLRLTQTRLEHRHFCRAWRPLGSGDVKIGALPGDLPPCTGCGGVDGALKVAGCQAAGGFHQGTAPESLMAWKWRPKSKVAAMVRIFPNRAPNLFEPLPSLA